MRDDFTDSTKSVLANRVALICSNPACAVVTKGPDSRGGVANIGVAAHISAASKLGPRFDASLTTDDRKHIHNGIWLCQSCAKLIDSDVERFSVEVLREWKSSAELRAASVIGTTHYGKVEHHGYSGDTKFDNFVKPHFYIEHNSNYTQLYIKDCQSCATEISGDILFANISEKQITHLRITAYLFVNNFSKDQFTHYYDVGERQYIPLFVKNVGLISAGRDIRLPHQEIIEATKNLLGFTSSDMDNLLFPKIGDHTNPIQRHLKNSDNQMYTKNGDLLKKYFHLSVNPGVSDSIGGMPLKIKLDYKVDGEGFELLVVGGMYYYAVRQSEDLIPLPQVVGFYVKPSFSIRRLHSGSTPGIVLNPIEINDTSSGEDIEGVVAIHMVFQPKGSEILERIPAIIFDEKFIGRKLAESHDLVQSTKFSEAKIILDALVLMYPAEPWCYINRGTCLFNLGLAEQSYNDYCKAAELGNDAGIKHAKEIGLILV